RLEDELSTRLERVAELPQHRLVLLVGEVAEAREPVDECVELLVPRKLAHVAVHVFDLDTSCFGIRARPVEEELAGVEAGYPEAALGERVGDATVSTRTVENLRTGQELEQLDDLLDVVGRPLGREDVLVEVEVVLVE